MREKIYNKMCLYELNSQYVRSFCKPIKRMSIPTVRWAKPINNTNHSSWCKKLSFINREFQVNNSIYAHHISKGCLIAPVGWDNNSYPLWFLWNLNKFLCGKCLELGLAHSTMLSVGCYYYLLSGEQIINYVFSRKVLCVKNLNGHFSDPSNSACWDCLFLGENMIGA